MAGVYSTCFLDSADFVGSWPGTMSYVVPDGKVAVVTHVNSFIWGLADFFHIAGVATFTVNINAPTGTPIFQLSPATLTNGQYIWEGREVLEEGQVLWATANWFAQSFRINGYLLTAS